MFVRSLSLMQHNSKKIFNFLIHFALDNIKMNQEVLKQALFLNQKKFNILMIEVESEAVHRVQTRDQTDHRKEHLCADLLSLPPRCFKRIPLPPKSQKKGVIFESILPRTIKGLDTFYYILKRQKSLLIYEVHPSVTCIQFNFEIEPIGLHIFNNHAYFLTSLGSVAVASLLNNQQATDQQIPTLGKPYSMYAGYPEDAAADIHGQSNMVLKIAHWNKRLEVYEFGRQNSSWFGNLLRLTENVVPYERLIVIQPSVLGCAIIENSLRFVNLHTKSIISSDFYITFPKVNCQKIELVHCPRVNFVTPTSQNHIQLILGYYILQSSSVYLYKVTLPLQVLISESFVYLDQLAGNLLLNEQSSVELLMELYLPDSSNQLKNVLLTYEGVYMVYQEDNMAIYTSCVFRGWNDIIQERPTELLDSAISKFEYEDTQIEDEELMRNRIAMPDRFPYGLLYREYTDLFTRLKTARIDQLQQQSKRYTQDWIIQYRLHELLEFRGSIYGIRNQGISIFTKSPSYMEYYYENFTKIFQRMTKQRSRNSQGEIIPEESNIINKIFDSQLYTRLSVCIDASQYALETNQTFIRGKPNAQQDRIYSNLLKLLRRILTHPLKSYEGASGVISPLAANLVLSQTRHQVRVIAELLYRLYPQSRQDISYDDKRAIRIIYRVNKLLQSSFEIFSRTQIAIQQLTSIPVYLDLLTIFTLITLRQNNGILFASINNSKEVVDSLIKRLFSGIVWLHFSADKISYTRTNELMTFACEMAEQPLRLIYYIEQLIKQKSIPTNKQFLIGCSITKKLGILRERLFQLPAHIFETQYQNILSLYRTNSTNLDLNHQNCKARAVVQSIKLPKNPETTTANELISETSDPTCKKILSLCFRNQVNEEEIYQQWSFLRRIINQGGAAEVMDQLISKKENRVSQILDRYKNAGNPSQTALLLRGLYQIQCDAFNRISELTEPTKKVIDFIKVMKTTIQSGIKEFSQAQGIDKNKAQEEYLDQFEGTIYGKIPTFQFISLLEAAQLSYNRNVPIPFKLVPRYVVYELLKSSNAEYRKSMMSSLLKYFPNSQIATQIVTQAQPGSVIRDQVGALGYAAPNYSQLVSRSEQAGKLLAMLDPANYKSLQREATLAPKKSSPGNYSLAKLANV